MDIDKLPEHIISDLEKRGHTVDDIKEMTPEFAFDEFCQWNALGSWVQLCVMRCLKLTMQAARN